MSDFGTRLRETMHEAKVSQKALSEKVGVSDAYISMLCSNKNNPSKRTIDDIASALGVNSEWLISGTGPKQPDPSREELIAETVASVLNDKPGSFQERVIKLLASLTYEEKVLLENVINRLIEKREE